MYRILNLFISLAKSHFIALIQHLDPVESDVSPKIVHSKIKYQFAFASLLVPAAILAGTVGLDVEAGGARFINWNTLSSSPYLFTHQVVFVDLWLGSDMTHLCVFAACFACFAIYSLSARLDIARMSFDGNRIRLVGVRSRQFSRVCSFGIIRFHCRTVTFLYLLFTLMELILLPFFYINVYLNFRYQLTIFSALFWLTLYPVLMLYAFILQYVYAALVIVSSHSIVIQQRSVLKKFSILNKWFANCKIGSSFSRVWRRYLRLNSEIIEICGQMRQYAHFWSPYLSILFPALIFIITYVVYILNYIQSGMVSIITGFIIYVYIVYIHLLVNQCTNVVKCNEQLQAENRKFHLRLQMTTERRIPALCRIRSEQFQYERRLRCYAFVLFDNYRISSETYYMLLWYISSFYMLINPKNPSAT